MQPEKHWVLRLDVSASPAARPVNRNNLSARLREQGAFIRGLKERKLCKFTMAAGK